MFIKATGMWVNLGQAICILMIFLKKKLSQIDVSQYNNSDNEQWRDGDSSGKTSTQFKSASTK